MLISEIFVSIQGESTHAGLPCIFIRLQGCNLGCARCDTEYAQKPSGGREMSVDDVIKEVGRFNIRLVEITGGEPLVQEEVRGLVKRLLDMDYRVLMETNGSISLKGLDERLIKIVDVKCPSSGHGDSFLMENLERIGPRDEVKFVIGDRTDYEYAREFAVRHIAPKTDRILFAPLRPVLDPRELAGWILRDSINVRLQVQIHTYIGVA